MVFPNRSSNRGGRRRGAAAAELAVLAPLLLFVLIVAIDFCRLFFDYTIITNAARNGALWASDPSLTARPLPVALRDRAGCRSGRRQQPEPGADCGKRDVVVRDRRTGESDGERYRTISV